MNTPLYSALMAYSKQKKPFHMPGHKLGSFEGMKLIDLTALDVTEANGLDNLYEAEGIIQQAMQEMSRFYGSQSTLFLTNGSTAGILASLMSVCKPGDQILIARNCHHSVWHALILIGAMPIYIQPDYDEIWGIMGAISPQTIQQALIRYPDVKGAVVVSPTYEGIVSEIQEIAQILHEQDKVLIVDEAHGAHFVVNEIFPKSSIGQGADLVIQSMHKTLPTLTQSALLHRGTSAIKEEDLIQHLRLIQTSSPSYAMMGLMDYIRGFIEENKLDIQKHYIDPLKRMRQNLSRMKKLKLLNLPQVCYDQSKIVILTQKSGIDGYTLGQYLETGYAIVAEAMLPHLVILMTTVADNQSTLSELENALKEIDDTLVKNAQGDDLKISYDTYTMQRILKEVELIQEPEMSLREVYYKKAEWELAELCIGRICAQPIMLYPPGIPIIGLGECIKEIHIDLIKQYAKHLKGLKYRQGQIHCKVLDI